MKKILYMAIAFAFVSSIYAGVTSDKPKKNKKNTMQCCKKTDVCCKKDATKK